MVDKQKGGDDAANVAEDPNNAAIADEKDFLPEEAPTSPAPTSPGTGSTRTKRLWLWAVLGLIVVAAVVTTVSLVLTYNNNEYNNSFGARGPDAALNGDFSQVPFEDSQLPLLTPAVVRGYGVNSEFFQHLTYASESIVNNVVRRNNGVKNYGSRAIPIGAGGGIMARGQVLFEDSSAESSSAADQAAPVGNDVNDFDTNNQEEGVSEGDRVVTNGRVAFAAYGDYIIGWNVTTGAEILQLQIEPISMPPSSSSNQGRFRHWTPKPRVRTLLLHSDYLVAVAEGYSASNYDTSSEPSPRVFRDYADSRLFVYDIQSVVGGGDAAVVADNLPLVAQSEITGSFNSVRMIDNTLHVIVTAGVNFYPFLVRPFERWNDETLKSLNTTEYAAEVGRRATETEIPNFIEQMTQELSVCGQLPRLVQINRWMTNETAGPEIENFVYAEGFLQSLVAVASFDLTDRSKIEQIECYNVTGAFLPTNEWGIQVYSAREMMILSAKGYDYSEEREATIDTTYLVSLALSGTSVIPHSIGHMEGHVLNQFSFRVDQNDVLYVATTVQNRWWWGPVVFVDVAPETIQVSGGGVRRRKLEEEETDIVEDSSTENYIITMDLRGTMVDETGGTAAGSMVELDRLALGKKDEVFTAVRFYDGLAYAVTFERVDPFYVVDTSDPTDLQIKGLLDNITGWSSYLEPINDDNTIMLAIGQEADPKSGAVLGLQISVFDARDLDNVHISARFLIETEQNVWSGSDSLWDKNAVRFNAETGRLILPLNIRSWAEDDKYSFDGFRVFIVTENSIVEEEACRINFSPSSEDDTDTQICRYCASLAPRAMIIRGNLMTTMDHFGAKLDLNTCERLWDLEVSIEADENQCCRHW